MIFSSLRGKIRTKYEIATKMVANKASVFKNTYKSDSRTSGTMIFVSKSRFWGSRNPVVMIYI